LHASDEIRHLAGGEACSDWPRMAAEVLHDGILCSGEHDATFGIELFDHADNLFDDRRCVLLDLDVAIHERELLENGLESRQPYALAAVGRVAAVTRELVARIQLLKVVPETVAHRPAAIGGALECGIVDDDDDAVATGMHVELEHVRSERVGERK